MPDPRPGESEKAFVDRYMASEEAQKSFPDPQQRLAVAYSKRQKHHKKRGK